MKENNKFSRLHAFIHSKLLFLICLVVSSGGLTPVRQSSPSQRRLADRQTDIKQDLTDTESYEVGECIKCLKKTTKAVWRQQPPQMLRKALTLRERHAYLG